MTGFAPVAQDYLLGEKYNSLDIAMEKIFLGNIAGSPSAGKILTCLFPFLMDLLNLCLPLNTDTTSPKLERASLTAMIANELRKEDGHKDRFSPISDRTNSFPEIKTDF